MGRTITIPPFSPLVADGHYCHFEPSKRPRDCMVSCAGRERCLPHYYVRRQSYGCYAMEFVAEGGGKLQLDGKNYPLQPGHLFVYGPGIPHSIGTDELRPMLKFFVNFHGAAARPLFHSDGLQPGRVVRVLEIETMRHLFEEMIREGRKSREEGPALARAYLEILFLKTRESQDAAERSSSRSLETLQRCRQILDLKFASLHGLDDFSREAGLDPSHLCRLFKRFRQGTPHSCLTRRKMDAAAALLVSGSLLVKEVAEAVGYDDALHFSRLFRKYYGCSPRAFRAGDTPDLERS